MVTRDGDRIIACTIGATGFLATPGRLPTVEELVLAEGAAVTKAALADALADLEIAADDAPYRRAPRGRRLPHGPSPSPTPAPERGA